MKTKFYKKFTIALVSLIFLAGCSSNFLDIQQQGVTKVTDFYKTDADATGAIIGCYNMMRAMNSSVWTSFWMTKESLSDDIYTGGENAGDRFVRGVGAVQYGVGNARAGGRVLRLPRPSYSCVTLRVRL